MSATLDIMTNEAGELVRREHARELGSGVVIALYRLAKIAQVHDLTNQAYQRQLDQSYQLIQEYCLRSGVNVSVLFADKATFVAGQLLKGNRAAYDAAAELGQIFQTLGGAELTITRDVQREDLHGLAEQISTAHRMGQAAAFRCPPHMHLRRVGDAARLRGMELEALTFDQRIVRTYASAIVILRRFFEGLSVGRYELPARIKRVAQSLVDLSDSATASFLGVTEVRNANFDEAGRAVNTAILAVAAARQVTRDRVTLSHVAMAALMHDVARPRALAQASRGSDLPIMAGPTMLSEDQEDRLSAGSAAVLTALGRVNEPSITRTVLTFEALWLRRQKWLGPVYWGTRPATLHATLVAVARRYNDLLTPEPGLAPPTTDSAIQQLASELDDAQAQVALELLVAALRLLPAGTTVELSTGEIAEVTRGASGPFGIAWVKRLSDPRGVPSGGTDEVELSPGSGLGIVRVLSVEGWRKTSVDEPPPSFSSAPPPPPPLAPPPVSSAPSRSASSAGGSRGEDLSVDRSMGSGASAISRQAKISPTARGDMAATPLPHVLAYMLDRARTGSVVFTESSRGGAAPLEHVLMFVEGVPVGARLGDERAPDVALEGELLRRIEMLACLTPEDKYALYMNVDLLEGWGSRVMLAHPLSALLASVRAWTERARVHATVRKLGARPLRLHGDVDLSGLALRPEETRILAALGQGGASFQALVDKKVADQEAVATVVYTLAVARYLAIEGQKKPPMGPRSASPPASLAEPREQDDDARTIAFDPGAASRDPVIAGQLALASGEGSLVSDAIRALSKHLIEEPSDERALLCRGRLLVKQGRYPEALMDFEEILHANRSNTDAAAEIRALKAKIPGIYAERG
jgi:hypothetical protein